MPSQKASGTTLVFLSGKSSNQMQNFEFLYHVQQFCWLFQAIQIQCWRSVFFNEKFKICLLTFPDQDFIKSVFGTFKGPPLPGLEKLNKITRLQFIRTNFELVLLWTTLYLSYSKRHYSSLSTMSNMDRQLIRQKLVK